MSADISTLSPQAVLSADKAGRFGKVVCNSSVDRATKGCNSCPFGVNLSVENARTPCVKIPKALAMFWQIGGGVGIDLWGDGLNDERCLGDDFARIKQEGWHLTERIDGGQLGKIFLR